MGKAFAITAYADVVGSYIVNIRVEYAGRIRPGAIRTRMTYLDLRFPVHIARYRNLCQRVLPLFRSTDYATAPFLGSMLGWSIRKRALTKEYGDD